MKYIADARGHFRAKPCFSVRDLRIFLAKKGISKAYTWLLIHNLVKSGEISRLGRGVYTFSNDLEVAGFAFPPFYYGLQDALSIRNLSEQETNPVVITPRKVRSGVRQIMGSNVLVRRISRKMFFGFEMLRHAGHWLPVSDAEKTLIDFAHFNEHLPEDALHELKKRIKKSRLDAYLRRAPERTKKRVKALLR